MICSSVNRFLFIVRLLLQGRTLNLRGGNLQWQVSGVVLGALFIGLVQNGMNLARIDSYLQMVVIGAILILAVIADRLRQRLLAEVRD